MGFANSPTLPVQFSPEFLELVASSGDIYIIHLTACPPFKPGMQLMETDEMLSALENTLDLLSSQPYLEVITDRYDLRNLASRPSSVGVLLGVQAPPSDPSPLNLERLYETGLRSMTLAYSVASPFGHGYGCPHGGLTAEGKELIANLLDAGIILDASHANNQTMLEALSYVESVNGYGRVMVSHSGCYSVYPEERNCTDEVLSLLDILDAYFGVYSLTFGTSKTDDSLAPFVKHAQHACSKMKAGHVGIGSDGAYRFIPKDQARSIFDQMKPALVKEGFFKAIRYPDQPEETNSANRHSILVDALDRSGLFTPGQLQSLAGASFFSFLQGEALA